MKRRSFHALVSAALTMAVMAVPACPQPGFAARRAAAEAVGATAGFVELVDRVKPAVVNISTSRTVRTPGNPFQHFFGPFRGSPFGDIPDRERKQRSLGSGFIIDAAGHIITNNHVVAGAEEIRVKLADGRELPVQVVGRDSKTDIALLKMAAAVKDLQTLPLGDSDDVKVGEWVIAIGNPFGLALTVTQGIVSATGRVIGAGPYDDFIQTDAAINPGNSGGPLFNTAGEVVGINTAIFSQSGGNIGIGFAVPVNMVKNLLPQLKAKGPVSRGWLGVSIGPVSDEMAKQLKLNDKKGALVVEVIERSPADRAGIQSGDVVVAFDGKEVAGSTELPRLVGNTAIGKEVTVRVIRESRPVDLKVTIREFREDATPS